MLSKVYIKKTINIYFLFLIIYKTHIKAVEIRNLTMENFKANEFLTNVFAKDAYKNTVDKFAEMRFRASRVKRYSSLESLLEENVLKQIVDETEGMSISKISQSLFTTVRESIKTKTPVTIEKTLSIISKLR